MFRRERILTEDDAPIWERREGDIIMQSSKFKDIILPYKQVVATRWLSMCIPIAFHWYPTTAFPSDYETLRKSGCHSRISSYMALTALFLLYRSIKYCSVRTSLYSVVDLVEGASSTFNALSHNSCQVVSSVICQSLICNLKHGNSRRTPGEPTDNNLSHGRKSSIKGVVCPKTNIECIVKTEMAL